MIYCLGIETANICYARAVLAPSCDVFKSRDHPRSDVSPNGMQTLAVRALRSTVSVLIDDISLVRKTRGVLFLSDVLWYLPTGVYEEYR